MTKLRRTEEALFADVRRLIDAARQRVASTVNAELSLLYWHIGQRIRTETLRGKRADYGKRAVATLSQKLRAAYGKGWSERQLWYCLRTIVHTLCAELSWSHLRLLLSLDDPSKRDFYIEMCRLERWSVRRLQERIQSMLFERTAISKKPEETIRKELSSLREEGQLSPALTFRDPYVLNFLGLADSYSEQDLESAILAELQRFIIELGSDFAFLARQKRITIDKRDYKIDLLFFHRRLKALVPSISTSASSRPPRRGRWSFTCVTWRNTSGSRARTRPSG
jgi:predicted nuclease of restriction endonuclease-like (RecB) superfamily